MCAEGFSGFVLGLVPVAFNYPFGCFQKLVKVADVTLILAVAEVANCVDACDRGIDELVGVCHGWISDVFNLELDGVAQSFTSGCFNMTIVSAIVFRGSVQISTVDRMVSSGSTLIVFLWIWTLQPIGANSILL